MTKRNRDRHYMDLHIVAERTSLSSGRVRHYIARGIVEKPLTEADLAELRRIRRLQELGVNLAGIEIILRMRQRLKNLNDELARWQRYTGGHGETDRQERWQRRLPWEPE